MRMIPPTHDPKDCLCGAALNVGRRVVEFSCPCCDGALEEDKPEPGRGITLYRGVSDGDWVRVGTLSSVEIDARILRISGVDTLPPGRYGLRLKHSQIDEDPV